MHKIEWLNQSSFTPIPEKCQSPPRRDPGSFAARALRLGEGHRRDFCRCGSRRVLRISMPVLRPVFMQPAARPSPVGVGSDGADSVLRSSRRASLLSGAAREMRKMAPGTCPAQHLQALGVVFRVNSRIVGGRSGRGGRITPLPRADHLLTVSSSCLIFAHEKIYFLP